MNPNSILMIAISILGLTALIGFFITKSQGFGRYTSSILLLLLVITLSTLLVVANRIDTPILVNIFFAIIGFATGLFTKSDDAVKKV